VVSRLDSAGPTRRLHLAMAVAAGASGVPVFVKSN
jgi:hypothetical protein